jgi:hypothetical protein
MWERCHFREGPSAVSSCCATSSCDAQAREHVHGQPDHACSDRFERPELPQIDLAGDPSSMRIHSRVQSLFAARVSSIDIRSTLATCSARQFVVWLICSRQLQLSGITSVPDTTPYFRVTSLSPPNFTRHGDLNLYNLTIPGRISVSGSVPSSLTRKESSRRKPPHGPKNIGMSTEMTIGDTTRSVLLGPKKGGSNS